MNISDVLVRAKHRKTASITSAVHPAGTFDNSTTVTSGNVQQQQSIDGRKLLLLSSPCSEVANKKGCGLVCGPERIRVPSGFEGAARGEAKHVARAKKGLMLTAGGASTTIHRKAMALRKIYSQASSRGSGRRLDANNTNDTMGTHPHRVRNMSEAETMLSAPGTRVGSPEECCRPEGRAQTGPTRDSNK